MATHRPLALLACRGGRCSQGQRNLPEEVPVALSYNGTTQAVMMATPADLTDFAIGFSLTEGIARGAEITEVTVVAAARGIDLQIWLTGPADPRVMFETPVEQRWRAAAQLMGIDLTLLQRGVGHA